MVPRRALAYISRHREDAMDARRRKLAFRAARRGMRELDLIVGAFAEAHLSRLDERQLDRFEQLLDVPDQEMWSWLIGEAEPPPQNRTDVLDLLRTFRYFARFDIQEPQGDGDRPAVDGRP
jgi:antitoxin CptB